MLEKEFLYVHLFMREYHFFFHYVTQITRMSLVSLENQRSNTGTACAQVEEVRAGVATSTTYDVSGLESGKTYYARVSASNEVGYGSETTSEQSLGLGIAPMSHQVMTSPDAVTITNIRAISGSQVEVQWSDPENNGDEIEGYLVEWWSQAPTFEVQTITLTNTEDDTLGYFVLTHGQGSSLERTVKLSWDSSAADVQRALNNLNSLGHVVVENTYPYVSCRSMA